jgi:lysyl-tRNA synthetase class 2
MTDISKILDSFDNLLNKEVSLSGRIINIRKMKTGLFVDLMNKNDVIQLFLSSLDNNNLSTGDLINIRGKCFYTKRGEPTIKIKELQIVNKWNSNIGYKLIKNINNKTPLKIFLKEKYIRCYTSYRIREHIRDFLKKNNFMEVYTPVLCEKYNGGRSFPVKSICNNNIIGYNRATMEEKMQALVGSGFERIFQIGNVFRSLNEFISVEGYASNVNWNDGQMLIRKLLQYVIEEIDKEIDIPANKTMEDIKNNNWKLIDFVEGAVGIYGRKILKPLSDGLLLSKFLVENKIIKNKSILPETAGDIIAKEILKKQDKPTLINGFPLWNSPLYLPCNNDNQIACIQRSKVYFPGLLDGGFDMGVQENNYKRFLKRIEKQRKNWSLQSDDSRVQESELETILSCGMPPMFGFGFLEPDRITRIWRDDCTIDPFEK